MKTRAHTSRFLGWGSALCLVLIGLLVAPASARRHEPQEVSVATEVGEVGVVILDEHIGSGGAAIQCRLPERPASWAGHASLFHRLAGTDAYHRIALEPLALPESRAAGEEADGVYFQAVIPHQARGTRVEYYLELNAGPVTRVTIPSAGAGAPYALTFKGRVSRPLLIAHVLAMMGGMVPLAIGFVAAFAYLFRRRGLAVMRRSVLIGFVLLFIGGVPLGIPVEYQVFGTYWEGWPFGRDVTDTKTGLLLLLWLVLLLVRGRDLLGRRPASGRPTDRTWAGWVIALVTFTVALYLIPHENIKF